MRREAQSHTARLVEALVQRLLRINRSYRDLFLFISGLGAGGFCCQGGCSFKGLADPETGGCCQPSVGVGAF
jgi:hypothetical protein